MPRVARLSYSLRRYPKVTRWHSAEVTHSENGTGNGSKLQRPSSSTPKACSLVGGVEEQAISSTPQACGLVPIIRAEGAHREMGSKDLPYWRHAFELVTEILE